MKRLLYLLPLFALVLSGCNSVAVLEAQTLPITKTLTWDANPASDGVINYIVTQDGVVVGSPTTNSQSITIAALGPHTWTVVAVNTWGQGPPSTALTVTVSVPGKSNNLKIQ